MIEKVKRARVVINDVFIFVRYFHKPVISTGLLWIPIIKLLECTDKQVPQVIIIRFFHEFQKFCVAQKLRELWGQILN